MGSVRRIARQIVDLTAQKRKEILRSCPTEMKCKIVEEMVNIRLQRLRDPQGNISPAKVSERWELTQIGLDYATQTSPRSGQKVDQPEVTLQTFIRTERRFTLTSYRLVTHPMARRLSATTQQREVMASDHKQHLATLDCCDGFEVTTRLSFDNSRYFFFLTIPWFSDTMLTWKIKNN